MPGPLEEQLTMLKNTRVLALVGAGAIFASGCAGAASPSPSASQAASPSATTAASEEPSGSAGGASGEPSGSAGAVTLPTPEKTDLQIGLSVTETSQFAGQLAEQLGIYERNGLNVDVTVFEGDGKVMQALQAGQLDLGFGGTSAYVTSQGTDAPVVAIAVNASILSDLLVTTADVKTADDLRGKCVAVSTYGGTSHGAVILSLEALGLTPDDVVITEVGGQSARIAALQGGACAAAPVDAAQKGEMEELGFNFLVDLKQERLPWGRSGLGVTEEWLAENPNTATVVAASVLEAQNMMWDDPETAAAEYAEFTQSEPELAEQLIADFQEIGNRTMMWEDEAFENPKRVLTTVNPEMADIPVTEAFDRSVLEGLQEMGYYDYLGIPME